MSGMMTEAMGNGLEWMTMNDIFHLIDPQQQIIMFLKYSEDKEVQKLNFKRLEH